MWTSPLPPLVSYRPPHLSPYPLETLTTPLPCSFPSSLGSVELPPGQLPPSLEAEERGAPGVSPHLLALVVGRSLLGVVRQRTAPALTAGEWAAGGWLGMCQGPG